ncbi:SCO6880 family protein [Nocardiopsis deserti]|uniref:SCO6880 family protein n=1 Tax=Nocardiopsis deserti TaxID=2605988 RepID=UPI001CC25FE5|nr:SCO6880 family protein [Nocardiopsis deserti]
MSLLNVEDGRGGRYGLVWHRRTGHMTATVRTAPNSTWLAESRDVDGWVANWHAWLAGLGYMPWISWVAVTVESAPDPGSTLRHQVSAQLDPDAPAEAHKIMNDLVASTPSVSANVETRISITFDPRRFPANPKTKVEAIAELGNYLNELEGGLGNCGISLLGRATPQHLVASVRNTYDPAARGDTNRLLLENGDGLRTKDWADAGPMSAELRHDRYVHDSGTSVSWVWQEAPRTNVTSNVLAKLLSPTRYCKRTTILYRPWSAASAATALENQRTAAQYKSELSRRIRHQVSARDRQDEERAAQAAREESMGAGLVQMSMYVTVTVQHEEQLAAAIAQTESAAESSRIRLRRAWGSQDVAFAATLPLGICPPWLLQRLNGW